MPLAPHLFDALQRGAILIAANPRAARALHLQFADGQRAAGHTVWPSPAIYDWDSWLRELYRDHAFRHPNAPMLLTPLQERTLWTSVQREDAALVLSADAMAALAMEAWSRLSDYNAQAARRSPWEQTDAERFRHWAAVFERECARNGWISFSQLPAVLGADTNLALPPELCLVGFDRITPAQQALLAALAARGLLVNDDPAPSQPSDRRWMAAADAREEISACAAWARDLLLENPEARLGIIVPSVADLRGPIDRIFRRVLLPASEDLRNPSAQLPWEFSLGQPLADIPAIRAALLLLRWIVEPLPATEITWLLGSGFVAGTAASHLVMARHDAAQPRALKATAASLSPQRSLTDYAVGLAKNPMLEATHDHLRALLKAVAANHILAESRQPSAWTDLLPHLLDAAAWPGPRTPDSVQFQALQRWQRLLDDLALLDFDGTRHGYSEFLALLEGHARETIFAPESHDAPIQILGPFESSGQQFDALWFLQADDTRWPQRGRFHPLLPPAVQREFGMPHATPEDDWNLAHAVTARLLVSAPHIVFSYAHHEEDAELRPSPLIAGLFAHDATPAAAATLVPAPESLRNAAAEPIPDEPASIPWPSEQTAGGADILKRQSACPFQAFAVKRLAAEAPEITDWGFDPADKGKILHTILENVFKTIRTRDELVTAMATNRAADVLDAAIDAALAPYHSDDAWLQSYLAAEKRRLHVRLTEWLECEAKRQPFTVDARERTLSGVHVGDLRLNLRADRIDLLPDGSRLLLDYKTGNVSASNWLDVRPDEPQLPLYAAYGNVENLSGVLFAKIRAGKTGFDGRMRDAQGQLCPGVSTLSRLVTEPYSEAMREDWARVLRALADRFLLGDAAVNPRDAAVCRHCDFPALCRKAELDLAGRGDNEDGNA